ncbi:MAG: serpin family protein [Thermoplasmata archaeon]|nr:serpin family protein [Thermoplasmata archaeon]
MKKMILSVIVAIILILVSVISINLLYKTGDFSSGLEPTTVLELVDCSNEFSFEMYKQLAKDKNQENVFFSPYSITTALGMAYEGARGQTAEEMGYVLNFPADNETRWNMMKSYQEYFNAVSDSYNLSTANSYWLREGQNLNELYRNAIESYYLAHGEELDFAGDPAGSAKTINDWVEQQTNGKIKELISTDNIDSFTYLILTNAIYFKSDWKYQFNPDLTFLETFHLEDGGEVQTGLMHMKNWSIEFNYSSNDDDQLLQLPYKGGELSMYILLPEENSISSLESRLDYEYLNTLKANMTSQNLNIYMPRFKFEQTYELKKMLSDMGMAGAFSNHADFSGMTDSVSLKISSVIHQSFVAVNENGTEAAAATAVIMNPTSAPIQPILFKANHPFIFFILHEETGQILFMGKVGNPNA